MRNNNAESCWYYSQQDSALFDTEAYTWISKEQAKSLILLNIPSF